jgi:membrane protease YdiL (CAAX protease family)
MKAWLILILYVAGVLLAAAILSPLFYWIANAWSVVPLHRCVNRALMISAVLGGLVLMGIHHLRWIQIVGRWNQKAAWSLVAGLILGAGCLILLILFSEVTLMSTKFWAGLATALWVAPLEEWLFRGVLQTLLIRASRLIPGLLVGALFFAIVHFLKVPAEFKPEPVSWWSGAQALGLALNGLAENFWSERLLMLFLLGLVLGLMVVKTGALWAAIGFHGGAVWILRMTPPDALSDRLTCLMLAVLALMLWRSLPKPSAGPVGGPALG